MFILMAHGRGRASGARQRTTRRYIGRGHAEVSAAQGGETLVKARQGSLGLLRTLCLMAQLLDDLLRGRGGVSTQHAARGTRRAGTRDATHRHGLGVDAALNHGYADGQGAAVEVAVLRAAGGSAGRAARGSAGGKGRREAARTRMVEISWRMSTACCAAARLSESAGMAAGGRARGGERRGLTRRLRGSGWGGLGAPWAGGCDALGGTC